MDVREYLARIAYEGPLEPDRRDARRAAPRAHARGAVREPRPAPRPPQRARRRPRLRQDRPQPPRRLVLRAERHLRPPARAARVRGHALLGGGRPERAGDARLRPPHAAGRPRPAVARRRRLRRQLHDAAPARRTRRPGARAATSTGSSASTGATLLPRTAGRSTSSRSRRARCPSSRACATRCRRRRGTSPMRRSARWRPPTAASAWPGCA